MTCPTGATGPVGATGPERCNCTVQTTDDLALFVPPAGMCDGTEVFVQFEDEWYTLVCDPIRLAALNTTTPPGTNAVIPAIGGGFWFREHQAGLRQQVYAIDPVNGDDSNLGLLPPGFVPSQLGAAPVPPQFLTGVGVYGPIRTIAELQRRIGIDVGQIPQPITAYVLGNILEIIHLDVSTTGAIVGGPNVPGSPGGSLTLVGSVPQTGAFGSLTGAAIANGQTQITVVGPVLAPGDYIRLASGHGATVTAVVTPGVVYNTTPFVRGNTGSPAGPFGPVVLAPAAVTGQFQVVTPTLFANEFYFRSSDSLVTMVDIVQSNPAAAGISAIGFVIDSGVLQLIGASALRGTTIVRNNVVNANGDVRVVGATWRPNAATEVLGRVVIISGFISGFQTEVRHGGNFVIAPATPNGSGPTVSQAIDSTTTPILPINGGSLRINATYVTNGFQRGLQVAPQGEADIQAAVTGTATVEAIRVSSEGRINYTGLPFPVSIAASLEINLGGRTVSYAELVVFVNVINGVNVPIALVRAASPGLLQAGTNRPVVVRNGPGDYTITFANNFAITATANAQIRGAFPGYTANIFSIAGSTITVHTFNSAGAPADADFDVNGILSVPNLARILIQQP